MDEIVRRLRSRSQSSLNALKESLPIQGINEEDEELEDMPVEDDTSDDTSGDDTAPEQGDMSTEEEEDTPEGEESKPEEQETHPNPLENDYAVNYTIGQEVSLIFGDGSKTALSGMIEGYDKEGFYRIKWENGKTTNGITDIAIDELLEVTKENKCVCGSTEFVNENKKIVCDRCGRIINEGIDPLTKEDKSRPKGKRMIRSEAHPVSTSIQDSIRKAFTKKQKIEESEDSTVFNKLRAKLENEFWTRADELVDSIEELGYEVLDSNGEYVVVAWEDEEGDEGELQIPIGGTSRTLTLDFARARFFATMD